MVGGNTRVNSDLPPFFLYTDFNVVPRGLNIVGLRRAGFQSRDVAQLKAAYRLLYRSNLALEEALKLHTSHWHMPLGLLLIATALYAPKGLAALSDLWARSKP